MWQRFLNRSRIEGAPAGFAEVVEGVHTFVQPLLDLASHDGSLEALWVPPGPWSTKP